jgi:hypothetical protein
MVLFVIDVAVLTNWTDDFRRPKQEAKMAAV